MNVLGKKVEELNLAKKLLESGELTQEEFNKLEQAYYGLYYALRRTEEEHILQKLTTEQRKKLHKYVLGIYGLLNKIEGLSSNLIYDKSTPTNRPILFVPTHVGKHDIEIISKFIKEHYRLLSGDFEHIQGKIDGAFLRFVGVEYFNEHIKEDRASIPDRIGKWLDEKDNAMWFIEGTWNMKPDKPMLHPYWGIVDVAKDHNAIIRPIGIDQYDRHFEVAIGENFDMKNYGNSKEDKLTAISDLRNVLSTLKYDIWEYRGVQKRSEIKEGEWEQYKEDRFAEWPGFNEEYIEPLIYKPKGITEPEEAYELIKKMPAKKENAFLFDKRNSGNLKI